MSIPRLFPPTFRTPFLEGDTPSAPWQRWFAALWTILGSYVLMQKVVSVSATYSASPGETVLCDVSGGGFSVTLPLAAESGNCQIRVFKVDASGNTLTISRKGAPDKLNGANTHTTTTQYKAYTFIPDGVSNWLIF